MSLPGKESVEIDLLVNANQAMQEFRKVILEAEKVKASVRSILGPDTKGPGGSFGAAMEADMKKFNAATDNAGKSVDNLNKKTQQLPQSIKSSADNMKSMMSFLGSGGGQSFLSKFVGNYASANGAVAQIDVVKNAIKSLSSQTGASFSQAGSVLQNSFNVPVSQTTQAIKKLNTELGNIPAKTQGMIAGINVARIALGALVSMFLFQAIQAVTEFFTSAINQARQLEDTLFRLGNAERSLSKAGIEVSMKGLRDGIKEVQKLLPIFSKEDVSQLVGTLAVSTKQLGLNEDQLIDLAKAVGILNIRSEKMEDLSTTAHHVLSSVLTNNAKGISALGIAFTDNSMRAKAMELGFLKAGEALASLSDNEKGLTKLGIIIDSTNEEMASVDEYLRSNTARLMENKAAWDDLKATVGQVLLPFIPTVTEFFNSLEGAFNALKVVIIETLALVATFFGTLSALAKVPSGEFSLDQVKQVFTNVGDDVRKDLVNSFFPGGVPDDAPQWFVNKYGNMIKVQKETATALRQGNSEISAEEQKAIQDTEKKIGDAMEDARDKRLDIERDYQRKLEDIARNYSQKLQDIARNTAQKTEDANRNYGQKIEDINRDANQKIAEAQEDAHKKELDAEAEFQRKLAELRQSFLFDLEDALHERDARQVLRLIRQYNFDKKNLEDKRKLEQEESTLSLQHKLEDIEIERQQKLEAAKREHEEKLAEIALYAQRERADAAIANRRALADARLDHQRKLQENREYLKRKLQDIADAITKEFQLTAAGAQAISSLLGSYFGAGGAVASIFGGLQSQLGGLTQVAGSGAVSGNGSYQGYGYSGYGYSGYGGGFAEGGTLIATRPTKAIFGEKGPEQVSFAPLGRVGRNSNQVFGDKTSAGMGGSISLEVALSPDLEARIVDTTLDGVALHLEKVSRSK